MNKKLIIFDFDGVLINSKENMRISWNEVIKRTNSNIKFGKYFKEIGVPFENILKKIKFKNNSKIAKKIYDETSINNFLKIKLYSGVKKYTDKLFSKKITCLVTSKSKKRAVILINKFKLKFHHIYTPDDIFPGKPNPKLIYHLMKNYNLERKDIIVVGDMDADKKFAQNAKVDFVSVTYGYGNLKSKKKIKKIIELNKFL